MLLTPGVISHAALAAFNNELKSFLLRTAGIVYGHDRPPK